ncbi:HutD family protein [Paraburkholderia tagetis]|uniref:HutD family protein n=1 Tax=Paraburkholderia tagetis TaxID=2913261 RepID=A0A9X1RP04_9BURK|nr:HutD family protein [Paraburkholderia tagetis]MCG5073356.1 HutD family protein [Paraburkholderia tagetis]
MSQPQDKAHETGTAQLTLLRGADLVASPWKNGGGVTREIALAHLPGAVPGAAPGEFAWRVSVADVAQAGPFSRFEGVARTLVLLEGAGMVLAETSAESGAHVHTHTLTRALDVARFDGEAPIDARLVDGPTRDFNLMVRRGAARATFEVWRDGNVARRIEADTVLLYCAQGVAKVRVNGAEPTALAAGDTLRIDTAGAADSARAVRIETQGEGALLAIALDVVSAHADREHSRT